jgi:hypothetical protein
LTRFYRIFKQIGLSGGGKIKAVFHRMNALAEVDGLDPVLLSIDHNHRQKVNFAALQDPDKSCAFGAVPDVAGSLLSGRAGRGRTTVRRLPGIRPDP